MKELLEKDYNCFEWEGILMGREIAQNEFISGAYMDGIPMKRVALLSKLSFEEVKLRIKKMKLVRPPRIRRKEVLTN